ncbi:MAG: nodulation protein NfeD [Betaproteobacteria bacterium]|nr:nodulation protein NfeD [Betaproteobacteria bacterium]
MLRTVALCLLLLTLPGIARGAAVAPVVVLRIDGAISPGTADYVVRALARAPGLHASLVVLELDTPGGLGSSMREIIKHVLASPVPVAAFVYPSGARAASAGTYILYASQIAAMAPATNLGAATPVAIGALPGGKISPQSTEARKAVNDAAAYIRALAILRGRNSAWAEQAVRQAASLTATEALHLKVIDVVARSVPDLLAQVNGWQVTTPGGVRTLDVRGAPLVTLAPDWRSRLLTVITDPSIAYLLMLVGVYGLLLEFVHPGFVLPGVTGLVSLILALYAFQMLPVNYAGLALILSGIGFMVAEAFMPTFGALGVGGVIAFVVGSVLLIKPETPGFGVPWELIVPLALFSFLFLAFIVGLAVKARFKKAVSGAEEMIGSRGEVLGDLEREGFARVHGETWRIRSETPLHQGDRVTVVRREGLVLDVRPERGPDISVG